MFPPFFIYYLSPKCQFLRSEKARRQASVCLSVIATHAGRSTGYHLSSSSVPYHTTTLLHLPIKENHFGLLFSPPLSPRKIVSSPTRIPLCRVCVRERTIAGSNKAHSPHPLFPLQTNGTEAAASLPLLPSLQAHNYRLTSDAERKKDHVLGREVAKPDMRIRSF